MKYPSFIRQINGICCLTHDTLVTPHVEKLGTLHWDSGLQTTVAAVKQLNRPGIVIDAGAFIGDSTRVFLDAGYAVAAFEPQPDAFLCLLHNCCPDALCINFPVGDGERVRVQPVIVDTDDNLGARDVSRDENGLPALRIDDLELGPVACLKIDVEGWEPLVLRGARQTIAEYRPVVLVEMNPSTLARAGFTLDDILCHFEGWAQVEVFRYGNENWDIMFLPPDES